MACYENAPTLDLIYCAGGNQALDHIAHNAGFLLGIRSGKKSLPNYPVHFVDIEYRRPHFERHLKAVSTHRPKYATVPDLSEEIVSSEDISRAMAQYEQLAEFCEIPLIVPKLPGQIVLLPPYVAIGYSIPTSYGGAHYPLWELEDRHVHLLGGSPHQQMDLYQALTFIAHVMSADGNMAMKMATSFAKYWEHGQWIASPQNQDAYLECWRISCGNIQRAWNRLVKVNKSVPDGTRLP